MASPSEMISVQPTVRFFEQMTGGVEDEQCSGGEGSTAGWIWMVDTRFDDDDLYLDL